MRNLYQRLPSGKTKLNLHPGQTRAWLSPARFVFMLAGSQGGKALAIDTPIPTPAGFVPMGALCIGDTVYDDLGHLCTVTFATPVMHDHKCYRVMFDDGATIVADADHLWQTNEVGVQTTVQIMAAMMARLVTIPLGRKLVGQRQFACIERVPSVPVRCIQVDSPTHLYLAGRDYIVTHNTSFGPWWLWREIQTHGEGDYLAVTSTFDLFKLKMLPEMLTIYEKYLRIGRYWAGDKIIELKDPKTDKFWAARATDRMWGRIILRSASAKGGLESATAKAAWLDEAGQDDFSQDAYEAVLRRLSLNEGRVLGTTTIYNLGWVKQQVYDPWAAGDTDYDVIQFASVLNPVYSKREYERAERTMPSWKFKMFYKGEFSHPPGLIYDCYDDDLLKVKPFPIPAHWPRYVGMDPGGVNLATVWLAEDPVRKVFFAYRETLEGNMTTNEHVQKNLERGEGENVVLWCGGAPSEGQTRRDWANAGIAVREPAVSEVWAGIDRVIALFKTKRLFIFDSLVGLRDELGKYSRKLNKRTLEPEDEIKDKNTFHRLDSLRYITTRLDTATFGDIDPSAGRTANPWNIGQPEPADPQGSWWGSGSLR